jgi:hypothetical protein
MSHIEEKGIVVGKGRMKEISERQDLKEGHF